ncbi:glutamate racemase [soil metagenome]
MHKNKSFPIGVFDSGVGGITVLRAIRSLLPQQDLIYFGDAANMPYGQKSLEEIRLLSEKVTAFLIQKNCKIIVIACNTASAAALKYLREIHPEIIFVGMEPAVKPAAEHTQTGVVGVIATIATFQGELFASVVERFAQDVTILHQPCPGLVLQIENGKANDPETEKMLREWLNPMIEKNIDTLVLGCTHYPFVITLLKKILGEKVRIIDPAPAVARRVKSILEEMEIENKEAALGMTTYFTSGDSTQFKKILFSLTGEEAEIKHV